MNGPAGPQGERPVTPGRAFAALTAAMVSAHDVADVLARLLDDYTALSGAPAAALLVSDGGRLELLSATSHEVTALELLQSQEQAGPCVEALRTGRHVATHGPEALERRWGDVGRGIVAAGYVGVDAFPMVWRGRAFGGLNVFHGPGEAPDDEAALLGQAFADAATLVLLQSADIPAEQVAARVHEAVAAREQVEQAKGVLAQTRGIGVAEAYVELRRLARAEGSTLGETALRVVRAQWERG